MEKKFSKGRMLDFMIDIMAVCKKHGLFITGNVDDGCYVEDADGSTICWNFDVSSKGTVTASMFDHAYDYLGRCGDHVCEISTEILKEKTKTYVPNVHKIDPEIIHEILIRT